MHSAWLQVGPPPVARSADGDRGAFTSPLSFLDHVMPSNDYSPLAANLATPKTLPSFRAELNLAADTRGECSYFYAAGSIS